MCDQGTRVTLAMRELKKLFGEVSRVFTAGDAELDQAGGWYSPFGKKSWSATSDVSKPARWMPGTVYRYYKKDKSQCLVLLAVHLFEEDTPQLTEPWVAFGYFRYRASADLPDTVPDDWQWLHTESEHPADGTIQSYEYREDEDDGDELESQHSLAFPLLHLASVEDLRTLVFQPILEHIAALDE